MPVVTIENRSFVTASGEDAVDLLQSLITTDLALVQPGEAWPGALLTPQGKILFEFLVSRTDDSLLLETTAENADPLIKRLTLYRLRAKVTFGKRGESSVTVAWNVPQPAGSLRDMRFAKAGIELYRSAGASSDADFAAYQALRHTNGISGGGEDGALTDYFPHDLLMDRNGGLSFKKGCYIGQEVVSRMQHRGTARRRVVSVSAGAALPATGTEITAAGKPVGTLGSVAGNKGLAIVRIDRAGEAITAGTPLLAGDVPVSLTLPAWSGLSFPSTADEASA